MAAIEASTQTIVNRNRFGRFASQIESGCDRAVERWVELGAATSRAMAPGPGYRVSDYSRRAGYIPLKASIKGKANGHTGQWSTNAPHWKFVEYDTAPHEITGFLDFPWNGGRFVWNDPRYSNWTEESGATVHHPGTSAQPFMRPAYELVVKRQMMAILKSEMP
jgi:hypothetical protein